MFCMSWYVDFESRAMQVVGGQTTPQFMYSSDTPHEEAFHSDVWRSADGTS